MDPQALLDSAFSQAANAGRAIKGVKKSRHQKFIDVDLVKIRTVNAVLTGLLKRYSSETKQPLNEFEKRLIGTMVDVKKMRREARQMEDVSGIIKKITDEFEVKVKYADSADDSSRLRNAYYGRISSLTKKLNFENIELYVKKVQRMPKIKQMDTIIIAGYPNVGKSEILKGISGHHVKTAPYPFTTQNILIGYFKNRHADVQMIDTPGMLDRPIEKMNAIERRAMLAIQYLSKNILFVIDPSETCGYSLEEQLSLMETIKESIKPKMFTVATKKDIVHSKDAKADISINSLDKQDIEKLRQEMIKFFF